MKRKAILVAVVGVLCIFGGSVTAFIESFASDVNSTKENVEIIEKKYDGFKKLMESFNTERELLYANVINNLYIEDVILKYNEWFGYYGEFQKTIQSVEEYRDMLEERCLGILYNDSNIQSKCDSMVISYETAINYYVKDVNKFNKFLNTYNEGAHEIDRVSLFELYGYNYIDFNDDGNYLGE